MTEILFGYCEICGKYLDHYDSKWVHHPEKKILRCLSLSCLDPYALFEAGAIKKGVLIDGWGCYSDG